MNKKFKTNTVKCFRYDGIEVYKQQPGAYLINYSFNPKVRAISHVSFLKTVFVWHKKLPAIFVTLGNLIVGLGNFGSLLRAFSVSLRLKLISFLFPLMSLSIFNHPYD